jgi:acetyltransferase-like isoleucine patch superfamily enzyme
MNSFFARAVFRLRGLFARAAAVLRTAWWRFLVMRIGAGTYLPKIFVTWPHQVSLGRNCTLEHGTYFKFDGIWQPGPSLVIGDNVFIGTGCEFNFRRKIDIGPYCLIAAGCRFIDHDHGHARREIPMTKQTDGGEGAIELEEDVWLGANVVVLKGVRIARGAIIAAGAIVTTDVAQFEIWGGVPARKLGERPAGGTRSDAPSA